MLSNHADDTWLTIIALHYHCYDLFVLFCFFFMLKLLQYCNYIIIVMQIKLMLLLLLLIIMHFLRHCCAFCGLKWRIWRAKIYFSQPAEIHQWKERIKMVIRCKKPVEIETGSHCNDSTAFLHPLSKKSRCHFQSPNHGCKHRKQQTICHFSIFPARGRRSTKVKEASLMQITLVVAP